MGDNGEENLDFSNETVDTTDNTTFRVGRDYDPRPQEDSARRTIAYLLIGLLCVVVIAIFVLLGYGKIKVSDLQDFSVILGPLIALVSAATGFYYGTKSTSKAGHGEGG